MPFLILKAKKYDFVSDNVEGIIRTVKKQRYCKILASGEIALIKKTLLELKKK